MNITINLFFWFLVLLTTGESKKNNVRGNGNNKKKKKQQATSGAPATRCTSPNCVEVAIIGAGPGGLSTAGVLQQAGFTHWKIFEASSRVGGRVFTQFFTLEDNTKVPIEIGQRYIQGIQRNPQWDIAKKINFTSYHVNYNKVVMYVNGEVDPKPPFTEWDKAFTCAEDEGDRLNTGESTAVFADGRQVLDFCGWTNDSIPKDLAEWFDMEFEYGRAPEQFAPYAFPEYTYKDFRDADYVGSDDGGFSRFITYLRDQITDEKEGQINRNSQVVQVKTKVKNSKCKSTGLKPGCAALVVEDSMTGASTTWYAQHIVSTMPFGHIKTNADTLFPDASNPWAKDWRALFDRFIMGGYHSSYLQFSEKIWSEDTEFILTGDSDGPVIGFKPFDTGHPVHYWPGSNILQANGGGNEADHFDQLCFKDRRDGTNHLSTLILKRLEDMYNVQDLEKKLLNFTCSFWSVNDRLGLAKPDLYQGAWFQWGLGATPDDYTELLRMGEEPQNLFISGEMSCRRFYGFTHGAILAGWRDGQKILNKYGYEVEEETRCEDPPPNNGNAVPKSKYFKN